MKCLVTKDMYVSLRSFDDAVALSKQCPSYDLVLCVTGAYRMVDGKPVVLDLEELARV